MKDRAGSGWFGTLIESVVDEVNAVTAPWIPAGWIDDAASPADPSPEAREARARRLDQYATLLSVLLLFVVFIAVMSAAAYGETYVEERVRLRILMDVREALCRKLLDQPVGFYDSRRRGEMVQRVLGDVEGYAWALRLLLDGVIRGLLTIGTTLVLLVLLSWQLSLVCLLGIPFLLPMRTLMRRVLRRSHRRQQESEKRVQVLLQIFSGIRTVKAYGTEERRVREFRATDEVVTRQAMKVQRAKSAADALIAFINNFLAMVLAVGGGFAILRRPDLVSPAELVTFLVLVANLYQPLKRLIRYVTLLQDSMASVERTAEYLGMPAGSPDAPGATPFPGVRDAIRFERVSFSYAPGTPVLAGRGLRDPEGGDRGSRRALRRPGSPRSATSCCASTIPGKAGSRWTAWTCGAHTRSSFLARTAIVTQAPFLFHTSIAENIRQGRPDATRRRGGGGGEGGPDPRLRARASPPATEEVGRRA